MENVSYILRRISNTIGKLRGGTLSTYGVVSRQTKYLGIVLRSVCSFLTLLTLFKFDYSRTIDSE